MPNDLLSPEKGLWYARLGKSGRGVRSGGTYRPVPTIYVMGKATADRRVKAAVVAMPDPGVCRVFTDASEFRAFIDKCESIYRQWTGKGESRIVSFENRADWVEQDEAERDAI